MKSSAVAKLLLVGLHEAIEPRQPGFLAVVGVEDHRHPVELGHLAHVEGASHGARDAGCIIGVVGGLASNELAASAREGDHDGSACLLGGFHARIDGAGCNHVHSWDGELVLLGVVQQVHQRLAGDDPRLHGCWHLGESLLSHSSGLAHHLASALSALAGLRSCCDPSNASHAHSQGGRGGSGGGSAGGGLLPQLTDLTLLLDLRGSWGHEGLGGRVRANTGEGHCATLGRHGWKGL